MANHYTGFLKINLSAEIKLVPPLMKRLSQNKLDMVLFVLFQIEVICIVLKRRIYKLAFEDF
ncbi:hypothetical protein, partial [Phocaeicola vulgatus]|uniref:hypothetical protein n=1 Tax=Phocaeicola vulgatus TaxID=821 RepID=UPI0034A34833